MANEDIEPSVEKARDAARASAAAAEEAQKRAEEAANAVEELDEARADEGPDDNDGSGPSDSIETSHDSDLAAGGTDTHDGGYG